MKLNRLNLMLAMARLCINDKELCEKSGVAVPTLTQIKSGKRNPKPATIGKIARALGVDVKDLLEEAR